MKTITHRYLHLDHPDLPTGRASEYRSTMQKRTTCRQNPESHRDLDRLQMSSRPERANLFRPSRACRNHNPCCGARAHLGRLCRLCDVRQLLDVHLRLLARPARRSAVASISSAVLGKKRMPSHRMVHLTLCRKLIFTKTLPALQGFYKKLPQPGRFRLRSDANHKFAFISVIP